MNNNTYTVSAKKHVYSISELNREARMLLEGHFTRISVTGEISNLARPSSGHLYFTLKDNKAQIRCALFRNRQYGMTSKLADGMQINATAKISLYEGRGDYQLIIEHAEEAGDGALKRAYEQLKARLAALGWFEDKHKQPLPDFAQRVGLVTSSTGAAIRDVLSTLKRRFPAIEVIIYPTEVQGKQSAPSISAQINNANKRAEVDVLIVTRGGGSLEDLWGYNEEIVAKAIKQSTLPIISAVGHEVDFTIADFVADVRAATPTAAAELVSPNKQEYLQYLAGQYRRLIHLCKTEVAQHGKTLSYLLKRLKHPGQRIQENMQRLDELDIRLNRVMTAKLTQCHKDLKTQKLTSPMRLIKQNQTEVKKSHKALRQGIRQLIKDHKLMLKSHIELLDSLSPLAVLKRGYNIAYKNNKPVSSVKKLKPKDKIRLHFHNGEVNCEVIDE